MSASRIGAQKVWIAGSNMAPFVSDGSLDSNLLAANASKTVKIVDDQGNQTPAVELLITNSSGQACTVVITVLHNQDPANPQTKSSKAMTIASGGAISLSNVAVWQITEKNTGSGTQTGVGVQYVAILEPQA